MSKGVNRAVFDARQLFRPFAVQRYRELQGRAQWDAERLQDYSMREMRNLVAHAVRESPFYADHLGSEIGDLRALPLLTRTHLRECFDDIRARNIRKSRGRSARTGGSTGLPVTILGDSAAHREAVGWRVMKSWGVHPGDNGAQITRVHMTPWQNCVSGFTRFPTRRAHLNTGVMTPLEMLHFVDECRRVRPRVLFGYAAAIYAFAGFVESEGLSIPPPDVICVTADPLMPEQRKRICAALDGPVFDIYAAAEVPWIAAECRHHAGLHVQSDCAVVEILDDDGSPVPAGTWGRIVITDLLNRLFPLIRYEIGDVGRFLEGDCRCGSAFPRLDRIQGRIVNLFRFADGTILGSGLATIFNDAPEVVRQFRLHQIDMNTINMYCVPLDYHRETLDCIQEVADKLQARVGTRAKVYLKYVDALDHNRGKSRLVVSDVAEQVTSR